MMGVKLLQILIIVVFLGVIFYILRLSYVIKLEKRLASFAISSNKDNNISLLDKLMSKIKIITHKLGNILSKSKVLEKEALKYNKYISYDENLKRRGIDYIAFKILLGVLVIILSLVTLVFQPIKFDILFFLGIFIISYLLPDIYLHIKFSINRKRIENDLLKAIIIMNNAFKSGRNIMQAIEIVKNELEGPIQDEFKKIYLDISYGLSLDVVFKRFYERVKLEDAKYISSSLVLLNKTGGDIVKIFALIEKSMIEKKNLKNELDSLTASSRLVFKILIGLPFIFIIIIFILNPSYFKPLFITPIGIIILVLTILLYILYILVIKKVLEVNL